MQIQKFTKQQSGFTLLELLVVVGIIAILGGAVISNFGDQNTRAARGVATQGIAAVHNAFNIYVANESVLPDNLESLACVPYAASYTNTSYGTLSVQAAPLGATDPVPATTAVIYGGSSDVEGVGGGLGAKVANKFELLKATKAVADSLNDAGINNVRYGIAAACDNDTGTTESVALSGITPAAPIGAGLLQDVDIPNQAFEDPRPNGDDNGYENRSRGFSAALVENAPVMVWKAGTGGYNNIKVGADSDDILIGFGVGEASDIVGGAAEQPLSKAPFYGQVAKDKWSHYIVLVNVGSATDPENKAFVQAVLDARGDFLDEEIAEFQGQKV
jgi:prepilin-type N-terminal cleavage/methylation domain-containing protein